MAVALVTTSARMTQVCRRSMKTQVRRRKPVPTRYISTLVAVLSVTPLRASTPLSSWVSPTMAYMMPSQVRAQSGRGRVRCLQTSSPTPITRQSSVKRASQQLRARNGRAITVGIDRFFLNSFSCLSCYPPTGSSCPWAGTGLSGWGGCSGCGSRFIQNGGWLGVWHIMGNNPESREKAGLENQLLVGFENKPLTLCYANSILQVLLHHPVFSDIVGKSEQSGGILKQLRELLQGMQGRKKFEAVSTSRLMKFVEQESAMFERERHQDCHEFYIWLMNQINDQIKAKAKGQRTPLEEEFFSKRVTRTTCLACRTVTEREEEEVDLSLVLPEPNVSLNYAISNYSKPERLAGRDKFKCDTCDQLVEAEKSSLIKTLPNFLAVHLRRFVYDEARRGIVKLNWQTPFSYKLKVRANWEEKAPELLYKLVGAVVHLGTGENYGHYVAYIRAGGKWFVFNDDEVTETEDYMLESLWGYKGLSKCAYMLFYSL